MLKTWSTYASADTLVHHLPLDEQHRHGSFLCPCLPRIRAQVQEDGYTVVWLFTHNALEKD